MKNVNNLKTICSHHEAKYGKAFESRFKKCCDVFKVHKKLVKGGNKISLELAKNLVENHSSETVPGWQLCRNCMERINKILVGDEDIPIEIDAYSPGDEEEINISSDLQTEARSSLNESLDSLSASPMKTHGLPKHRCISYAAENFERTMVRVKENFAGAIGVDAEEISSKIQRCHLQRSKIKQLILTN